MSALELLATSIAGVLEVRRTVHTDTRGSFERIYDLELLKDVLPVVAQVNRAVTLGVGTVRGLHLQLPPSAEVKLVSCIRGRVFDVAVDVRPHSPTFGHWVGRTLEASSGVSLLIPMGCAHGIQALETKCEVIYVHSAGYDRNHEVGINPLDPAIGVMWPEQPTGLSQRDTNESRTIRDFQGVRW